MGRPRLASSPVYRKVTHGGAPQPPPDYRSVSRMPTGGFRPFDCGARRRSLMDGMVTRANCVELHALCLKSSVGKFLRHLHPSSSRALRERFDLPVSISQINRVRAALGISNHRQSQQQVKKRQERKTLLLKRSGRRVLGVCCYSLRPRRQSCFPSSSQPSRRICSKLLHRSASPTIAP
jgi:hypothetical protein